MITNDHIDLLVDGELSNIIELDAAEYIGTFEHQGRICDYYRSVNEGEVSFFYVVRADG